MNAIPAVFGVKDKHVSRLEGSPHNGKDITEFIKTLLDEKK